MTTGPAHWMPVTFNHGTMLDYTMALVSSHMVPGNYCGSASYSGVDAAADTAIHVFDHPLPELGAHNLLTPAHEITIAPNPALDQLNIGISEQAFTVARITSLDGRLLLQQSLENGSNTLDISSLAPGTYLVTLRGATLVSRLFVKE